LKAGWGGELKEKYWKSGVPLDVNAQLFDRGEITEGKERRIKRSKGRTRLKRNWEVGKETGPVPRPRDVSEEEDLPRKGEGRGGRSLTVVKSRTSIVESYRLRQQFLNRKTGRDIRLTSVWVELGVRRENGHQVRKSWENRE